MSEGRAAGRRAAEDVRRAPRALLIKTSDFVNHWSGVTPPEHGDRPAASAPRYLRAVESALPSFSPDEFDEQVRSRRAEATSRKTRVRWIHQFAQQRAPPLALLFQLGAQI